MIAILTIMNTILFSTNCLFLIFLDPVFNDLIQMYHQNGDDQINS